MGVTCSHVADTVCNMATEGEIREASRCIAQWESIQQGRKRFVGQSAGGGARNETLLAKLGGADMLKHLAELWYSKLRTDSRLAPFLEGHDIIHLRAKLSSYLSHVFNVRTSTGTLHVFNAAGNKQHDHVVLRAAHLRMIEQQGFSPDDFDLALGYFESGMREVGAPEYLIEQTVGKLRPCRDLIFNPTEHIAAEQPELGAQALSGVVSHGPSQHQQPTAEPSVKTSLHVSGS